MTDSHLHSLSHRLAGKFWIMNWDVFGSIFLEGLSGITKYIIQGCRSPV